MTAVVLLGICLFIAKPGEERYIPPASTGQTTDEVLTYGKYLATAADCVSCHTRPGGQPFEGGLAFETPFGTIFSPNITPDGQHGIGRWTEQEFVRALRQGVRADGQHLYPVFPYSAYTKLNDRDVHALYLYIRTLTASSYLPPVNALPLPFSWRFTLGFWKFLFFDPGRLQADPLKSAPINRGRYLVRALEHCDACHTPRNFLGGTVSSQDLTGGLYRDAIEDEVQNDRIVPISNESRDWSTPNLTPTPQGLGHWSQKDLTAYLKTGHNPRVGAFGAMSLVISNSTRYLTDDDLDAIAAYLRDLTPTPRSISNHITPEQARTGELIYSSRCTACHLPSGLGIPQDSASAEKRAPPLAGNAIVQARDPSSLINIILHGAHEKVVDRRSWPKMPGAYSEISLDDEQIAALCNYVRSSFGNQAEPVPASAVAKQR